MKKIGIVARTSEYFDKSSMYMYDSFRIICFENNCIPFMILPPQLKDYYHLTGPEVGHLTDQEKAYLIECIDSCDGIIIPGGDRWYDYDKFIYQYAYEQDKPILGICMGMQIMVSSETNENPIKNIDNTHYQKKKDYAHIVDIKTNTKLYNIIGKEQIKVNSYHNYHISVPINLKVSATSTDGYIEAIEDSRKKFVVGVQWHPEIMYSYDLDNKKIFKAFIDAL